MSKRTSIVSTAPHMNICVIPIGEAAQITATHEPTDNLDRSKPCPAYVRLAVQMVKFGERPEQTATEFLRTQQAQMSAEQRMSLWGRLQDGWCVRCGGAAPCECRGKIITIGK